LTAIFNFQIKTIFQNTKRKRRFVKDNLNFNEVYGAYILSKVTFEVCKKTIETVYLIGQNLLSDFLGRLLGD